MAMIKLARGAVTLWRRALASLHRSSEWAHGWPGMLGHAARRALEPGAVTTAAAMAYYAVFALFPLVLLSIAIASLNLSSLIDETLVIERLEFVAPSLGQLLGKNIDEIIQARGQVTIVALIGLVWSASSLFYMLNNTLNQVWGIQRGRPVWKRRGLAILLVLLIVGPILFLASFADSVAARLLPRLPQELARFFSRTGLVPTILLDVALFMSLYLMFPHATASWRELLPGAIAAGLLWELAKRFFVYFGSTYLSASNLIYGSVTAIMAILTWAYLSGLIFIFGAYLSVFYFQRRQKSRQPQVIEEPTRPTEGSGVRRG
jgi:membrane protein